jgi:hypothetical protein
MSPTLESNTGVQDTVGFSDYRHHQDQQCADCRNADRDILRRIQLTWTMLVNLMLCLENDRQVLGIVVQTVLG